jgi:hypothetical protein
MMFIDRRFVVVYGVTGSKHLECNSSIRTEKYTEQSNKSPESNKRKQNKQKLNNKTNNKQHRH